MTEESDADHSPSLAMAVGLFNEQDYFTCHDILEELWGDTLGDDRDFLQGLLHAAVSLFHPSEGNPVGAYKMHASSLRYLTNYPDQYQGVNLAQLRCELVECFDRAKSVSSILKTKVA